MPSPGDIRRIHVAARDLGMDDQQYRDLLATNFGGKTSCKDLTPGQVRKLFAIYKAKGWRPAKKSSWKRDDQDRKIVALWLQLHKAGIVKDRRDHAIMGFVKRMTGVSHLRWCAPWQKSLVIEELKQWLIRTAG